MIMSSVEFEQKSKELVAKYYNENEVIVGGYRVLMEADNVYTVWMCKILQNSKGLFSTPAEDGLYFEVTYNGDKGEMYVDAYKKWENFAVKV